MKRLELLGQLPTGDAGSLVYGEPHHTPDGTTVMQRVEDSSRAGLDASGAVYDSQRARMAFIRHGDVFVRDLRSGALDQLTRTNEDGAQPQWGSHGALVWRVDTNWYRWTPATGVAPTCWRASTGGLCM